MRDTQLSMDRFQPASAHPSPDEVPPGYKRTEVGVIPEDWEIKRLGDITSIRNQKTSPSDVDPNTLCVELEHIGQGDGRLLETATAQSSMSSKYRFFSGDVLFGRLRSYLRKFWHADRDGICTTEIWPLMADASLVDSGFLYAIVQSDQFVEAASISYGTHMPRADWNVIKSFEVRLPPLPEQRAIAAALSDADGLIGALDALIEKKRAIKQATMQQLLTGKKRLPGFEGECGSDHLRSNRRDVIPHEPTTVPEGFKSTVIGAIPQSWTVCSLKSCLRYSSRYGLNAAAVEYTDSLPTYLRITDISDDGRFTPSPRVSVHHSNSFDYFLSKGDLVFARTGASVGKSYLYNPNDGPLVFAGFLILITPDPEILDPVYLAYYVQSKKYWSWVAKMSIRSGQPGINSQEYESLQIPMPGIDEQRAIATVLSDMDAEIEALERRRDKTRLIKEGMMQELLTGRVRLV